VQDYCTEYSVLINLYYPPPIAKSAVALCTTLITLNEDVQDDERNETWTTAFGSLAGNIRLLVKPHHVVFPYNRQVKENP